MINLDANEQNYTISKWKGKDKYSCRFCFYDTTKYENIVEHLKQHEEYEKQKRHKEYEDSGVLILDQRGNPINLLER
ncbi:MAG: hypothetical protein GX163_06745 [Bacteroidetes bacterium]|nr:hypothetical protein [Bacteroidota bacterium]